MNSDESNAPEGRDQASVASKRWLSDAAGSLAYFPRGQAWGGYIVPDREREQAIRDADRRYAERSSVLIPFVSLLALPVVYGFYYVFGRYPILALALIPMAIVVIAIVDWQLRRPALAPLLKGLTRVPAADVATQRAFYRIGCSLFALIGITSLVAYLYEQRVAAIAVDSGTIEFYRTISKNLVLASFFGALLAGSIVGWSRLSSRLSPNKAMLGIFLFGTLTAILVGQAVSNFHDPQPAVILSRDTLYCQWRAGWTEIAHISQRSGRRGEEYVQVEFVNGQPAASCEIDGLNSDYAQVYDVIYSRWQAAKSKTALPGSAMMDRLRAELDQIPIGSSREKATAVLGPPDISGDRDTMFYVYPRAGTADPSSRRVVGLYLDEYRRVSRLAVYGLRDSNVIDDLSHEILNIGANDYPLLRFVLLDPKR
ncbi:hypothetical protein [Bradyrhizobium sp. AZCC 2230]|uniref:hypothetical protein n=1 Tax=Bradyrhizobium sp. AZCC 2230 TaxID=3117021 RepID=UPI002FF398AB